MASRLSRARERLREILRKSYALREETDAGMHPKGSAQPRANAAGGHKRCRVEGRGWCAMCCEKVREQLGRFVDDELAPEVQADVEAHVRSCATCKLELKSLRDLAAGLFDSGTIRVPSNLWASIERRLDSEPGRAAALHQAPYWKVNRKSWALAASVVLVVGLGMLGLSLTGNRVEASAVNFGVLLDALPLDAQKAFRKFLVLYDAKQASALDAQRNASELDFAVPEALPGGFRLQAVYMLRFGGHPGVAATYDREGEFLGTIFHAPVQQEDFGTHRDYDCVVGKHRGHKVEVGEWKLVHLTGPTTCHCVLSRLDEQTDLPRIMAAVAPASAVGGARHRHP